MVRLRGRQSGPRPRVTGAAEAPMASRVATRPRARAHFPARPRARRVRARVGMQAPGKTKAKAEAKAEGAFSDGVAKAMLATYDPTKNKKIVYGVFQQEVDPAVLADTSDETLEARSAARAAAADQLVNIGAEERTRRTRVGAVMSVATVALGAALFGAEMSPVVKAGAMYFPIALSLGFLESGAKGL